MNKNEFLEMSLANLLMWLLEQDIEEMEWDMKFTKATVKVKVALDIIPLEDVEKNDRN